MTAVRGNSRYFNGVPVIEITGDRATRYCDGPQYPIAVRYPDREQMADHGLVVTMPCGDVFVSNAK